MIYKYQGDTIRFNTVIKDNNGTALNSETPILHFEDSTGSNLHNGTGTFSATGSYYHQTQIAATWGTGPARYWWSVAGGNGSSIDVRTNEINILEGTVELPSYVYEAELSNYYSRISDYIDDMTPFKLHEQYNHINRLLESLNISVPRGKNDDGQYDWSLRALNAWWGIYDIVADDQVNRVSSDEEPWYAKFYAEGSRIYEDIKKKKIVFRDQVAAAESGISKPVRTAGSSIGTLLNNWDNSYGNGFVGDDFIRDWALEVIGTGTSAGLFETKVKWSMDSEQTFGTITTDYAYQELNDGVYVRFEKGTASGTTGIFSIGDKWTFTTTPIRKQVGGQGVAKSY